jgi:hypothetical protein
MSTAILRIERTNDEPFYTDNLVFKTYEDVKAEMKRQHIDDGNWFLQNVGEFCQEMIEGGSVRLYEPYAVELGWEF